ncbi:hypothetical protein P389DRAFT_104738 [Cystobasidium minutum MCA 4210]|uniref:uncharacterized protein n=1 Tax=Cystobasidium minutum MCA 4210 TaxID=1397322 RepID=UPI0034CE6DE0|eukprot:jgi/Rhomi1/104738/CE104737_36
MYDLQALQFTVPLPPERYPISSLRGHREAYVYKKPGGQEVRNFQDPYTYYGERESRLQDQAQVRQERERTRVEARRDKLAKEQGRRHPLSAADYLGDFKLPSRATRRPLDDLPPVKWSSPLGDLSSLSDLPPLRYYPPPVTRLRGEHVFQPGYRGFVLPNRRSASSADTSNVYAKPSEAYTSLRLDYESMLPRNHRRRRKL